MRKFIRERFTEDDSLSSRFMRSSIFSAEASTAAPLGPLLGQFQVPMSEFCESFNLATTEVYDENLELPVKLYKFSYKYEFFIHIPRLTFVLHQILLEYGFDLDELIFEKYFINLEDLWFIISVISSVYYEGQKSMFEISSEVFGYLTSSIFYVRFLLEKNRDCFNKDWLFFLVKG